MAAVHSLIAVALFDIVETLQRLATELKVHLVDTPIVAMYINPCK